MTESRGRFKNWDKIIRSHEMRNKGLSTKDIAEVLKVSEQMARYYLRQKIEPSVQKQRQMASISSAFWGATEEQRIEVARILNFDYSPINNEQVQINADQYNRIARSMNLQEVAIEPKVEIEEPVKTPFSLLSRVKDYLNGKITPDNIDVFFSEDEQFILRKSEKFLKKSESLIYGTQCNITNGEVILELIKMGIN